MIYVTLFVSYNLREYNTLGAKLQNKVKTD